MKPIRVLMYFVHLLRLVVHAGLTWNIMSCNSMAEWAQDVRATPLWPEVDKLEQERISVFGKGFGK